MDLLWSTVRNLTTPSAMGLSNQEVADVMNYIMNPGTTKKVCA
jgi:hypothetical protein